MLSRNSKQTTPEPVKAGTPPRQIPPTPTAPPASGKVANGGLLPAEINGEIDNVSATRLSRLDEKNALIGLNNRLAAIIDRNQKLESENAKLNKEIKAVEQQMVVTTNNLRKTFDNDNVGLRKQLEQAEKDKVKLSLSEANLKNQLHDANGKIQKGDKEISDLGKKLKDADAKNVGHEAEIKKQKDDINKLIKQNQDLTDENKKLKDENSKVKKANEDQLLAHVELQNALKSKGEELQLKAHIHEQEVAVIRTTNQNKLHEMGGKLQKEYDTKLEEAIKQLRADCERQIKNNKDQQDKLYKMKEGDIKGQLDKVNSTLKSKGDELATIMTKITEYDTKISTMEGERASLGSKLKGAEDKLKDVQHRLTNELREMEKLLKQLQDEKNKLINEYQDLMEVKVALDNEIATYRKLLEGEEERLCISPSALNKKALSEVEQQIITSL